MGDAISLQFFSLNEFMMKYQFFDLNWRLTEQVIHKTVVNFDYRIVRFAEFPNQIMTCRIPRETASMIRGIPLIHEKITCLMYMVFHFRSHSFFNRENNAMNKIEWFFEI